MNTFKLSRISHYKKETDTITGGFSPMHTARSYATFFQEPVVSVWRIDFYTESGHYNDRMYNELECGVSLTSYDHLIVAFPHCVAFIFEQGESITDIAACFGISDNPTDIQIRPLKRDYCRTLNDEELKTLMQEAYRQAMEYKEEFIVMYNQIRAERANQTA